MWSQVSWMFFHPSPSEARHASGRFSFWVGYALRYIRPRVQVLSGRGFQVSEANSWLGLLLYRFLTLISLENSSSLGNRR